MELLFNYDAHNPELTFRFDSMHDLVAFLVAFWELVEELDYEG